MCCPLRCKGNTFAAKQEQSQQQDTHSQPFAKNERNRLPRTKENPLPRKEEEHWIIIFWVLTLGCKIHLPFFRLPFPSPRLTRLVVISVLAPSSPSSTLCILVLPRAAADDSGLKQEKEKKARTENPATGRKVDIVCLWVLITKVQLVGDVYGCAFKLCI